MYQVIATASERAALALDAIAPDPAASSRILALARAAGSRRPEAGEDPCMDDIKPRLVLLKQPRRWPGAGPADLDHQAVIRACQDRQLSIGECARRFAARSGDVITGILTSHGIPLRPEPAARASQPTPRNKAGKPARPDRADIPPGTRRPGSVEARLRTLSITDPALLARAATIDRAAKDLITQAETLAQPRPAKHRPRPKTQD